MFFAFINSIKLFYFIFFMLIFEATFFKVVLFFLLTKRAKQVAKFFKSSI